MAFRTARGELRDDALQMVELAVAVAADERRRTRASVRGVWIEAFRSPRYPISRGPLIFRQH
jgi:hypothetical protein